MMLGEGGFVSDADRRDTIRLIVPILHSASTAKILDILQQSVPTIRIVPCACLDLVSLNRAFIV